MMKNILLVVTVAVLALSSCSKKCVQCMAYDSKEQLVNETKKVCGEPQNIKTYKKRYENNFQEGFGYTTKCLDVD